MEIEFANASYRPGAYGSGKLIRRTRARFGELEAFGENKTEAKNALMAMVLDQCSHVFTRRYLTADGVTFALYYANGWGYDIVRAGRVACSTGFGEISFHEALERMRAHFEQYTEEPVHA
jgi:hypothetical protein